MKWWLTPVLLTVPLCSTAQNMAQRHARIGQAYDAEHYADVARLIDAQIKQAEGSSWEDSLFQYLYKYGRAVRKLQGTDAGVAAAELIYDSLGSNTRAEDRLTALFDLSWTYYDAGRPKAYVRIDSIAAAFAESHPDIPRAMQGLAHQYLAFDHSIMGEHRLSLVQAKKALAVYAEADSVPPKQWVESYTAAGAASWHLGRTHQADVLYQKAMEALGNDTSVAMLLRKASLHGNLGILWQDAGDLVRSKHHYHESLRIVNGLIASATDPFTRDDALMNRSRTYVNLATVYFGSGDHGRAQELLDLAWADRSKVLQPGDPQLLAVRDRMADIQLETGALDKAWAMEAAYAAACREHYGQTSAEYLRACGKLATIAFRQGESAWADSLFGIGMAVGARNAGTVNAPQLLVTLRDRASMRAEMGRTTEAIEDLVRARSIAVKVYGQENYRVAQCDVLLAEQAYNAEQWLEARAYAQAALETVKPWAAMIKASRAPVVLPDPGLIPDAIYWKVSAEQHLDLPDSVRRYWVDQVNLAIAALARNRAAVSDADSKLRLTAAQQRLFGLALGMAYKRYARTGSETDINRFLQIAESNRSILLKEKLNKFSGLRFAGVPDSITSREQELLANLQFNPDDRAAIADLDKRERAYAEFLAHLEKEWPTYFALRYGERTPTIAEIREQILIPGRDLLSYTIAGDQLYALTIGPKEAVLVRMHAEGLEQAVRDLREAITRRAAGDYVQSAHRLYQLAFEPVAPLLGGKELLIIPDGALGGVNFEVLASMPGTKNFLDHLLIQRYTIGYLLSATAALQFAGLRTGRVEEMLAMAPGFTDQLKQEYLAQVSDSIGVDRRFLHFVRQPFAVRTANFLGRSASATVMTGGAASEEAFRKAADQYGILFLGTHAEMNPVAPMYSRLVLSKDGDGRTSEGDGYLHAYEIYEMDLKAQLAVIAACETGSGRFAPGEGVRSLGAGLAYAGCPSLVVALWSIDEKVSAEIITGFYNYLADGMPKHVALRQAKLDFLAQAQDDLQLPYYWAGLVVTGDVAPVEMGGRSWRWWAAGAVLLLLGILVLRRRRTGHAGKAT